MLSYGMNHERPDRLSKHFYGKRYARSVASIMPGLREILFVLSFLACVYVFFFSSSDSPTYESGYSSRKVPKSSGFGDGPCIVPDLNPWDPSILKYLGTPSDLKCAKTQVDLTVLHSNGTLSIFKEETTSLGFEVSCYFRCFEKVLNDDTQLNYSDWTIFKDSVQTNCEFVEVYCSRTRFPYTKIYSNNHNRIIPLETEKDEKWKPGVTIFVMDSVSHSQWRRSLPRTYEVLSSTYKSHFFKGMTKVGDNSFPNAVAFLSGKIAATEFGDTTGFYDDHPIIWRDFRSAGYRTFYAEDYPKFNLFSYLAKGFKEKPVDHYFRPFWLNVYWSYLHRKSTNLCYGNTPLHRLQLNYFSQFIQKYNGSATFALNWLTELGHDYMNQVQFADEDLAQMFREQYENLKNNFVFVMSDHGHRFDAIRQTTIGRMEENLPFFSMHIPERLQKQFNDVVQENTQKFTTFWDIHATLKDILAFSKTGNWEVLNNTEESKGTSLLRTIRNRSCKEAAIPDEYCTCTNEKPIDLSGKEAEQMASSLVSHVNSLLSSHTKCARLSLSKVLSASRLEYSVEHGEQFRISLEASPSSALLESFLRKNGDHFSVSGDVSRINRYGNSSYCVNDVKLRKFCFCKD